MMLQLLRPIYLCFPLEVTRFPPQAGCTGLKRRHSHIRKQILDRSQCSRKHAARRHSDGNIVVQCLGSLPSLAGLQCGIKVANMHFFQPANIKERSESSRSFGKFNPGESA